MSDHSNGVSGAALQALPIGLYVVDRDLRIVAWNAERERGPFGRPAKDVLGKPLSEVLPAEGYEALLPRLRRIFEHGEVLDEVAESPQDGKIRAFRVRRRPVFQDGVVTHVLSLFEDVSARAGARALPAHPRQGRADHAARGDGHRPRGHILYTNPADARHARLDRRGADRPPRQRVRPLGQAQAASAPSSSAP